MHTNGARGRRAIACEAWQLVRELCDAVRDRMPELAAELELSPQQCHVLKLIEPGKSITMRTLADALDCDASNITGIVDRLEARGLVERRTAMHDRRVKTLAVTRRGIEARERIVAGLAIPAEVIARLSDAELRSLAAILRHALRPDDAAV